MTSFMQTVREQLLGGKRASDRGTPAPVLHVPDAELERAIAEDRIGLRFQPQIDIATGRVFGVEALARSADIADPEILFARAANALLDERLSRSLQRKALKMAGQWTGELGKLRLSINLLPKDLERPGFERWLLTEIELAGLRPFQITAEIVESSLVKDEIAVSARLAMLRAAGVRIAIDDFGSGYGCLAYLTSLPIDIIKIDRALIADLVGGERHRIVVRAMVRMAKELGLKVLVEGVESPAQLELLREWGCDSYQGFLGSRALDELELARFVASRLDKAA
nr:EAL domain-containing protein [uncultured Sphingomonas sp.]